MISSLYILWAGRICLCVRRTWVVPSTHRRRATEVQTRTPTYGHEAGGAANALEGTANARRQYVERAFAVGFSACDSVRRRHGGSKRRALPVQWLQNHFLTPISRRRRRIWDVTPPQHQTCKSRSTYGGLWLRHYLASYAGATVHSPPEKWIWYMQQSQYILYHILYWWVSARDITPVQWYTHILHDIQYLKRNKDY